MEFAQAWTRGSEPDRPHGRGLARDRRRAPVRRRRRRRPRRLLGRVDGHAARAPLRRERPEGARLRPRARRAHRPDGRAPRAPTPRASRSRRSSWSSSTTSSSRRARRSSCSGRSAATYKRLFAVAGSAPRRPRGRVLALGRLPRLAPPARRRTRTARRAADVTRGAGAARRRCRAGVLDTQLAYYRARAPEYDAWFHRHGRYDRGADQTAAWHAELEVVRAVAPRGRPRRPATSSSSRRAPGSGPSSSSTQARGDRGRRRPRDARRAASGAARARGSRRQPRTSSPGRPPRRFDAVVACFFMSHVPDERFASFLELVAGALRTAGALLPPRRRPRGGLDRARPRARRASGPRPCSVGSTTAARSRSSRCSASDDELAPACARRGSTCDVRRTATYFQVRHGRRA